jgi:hypothetical protein
VVADRLHPPGLDRRTQLDRTPLTPPSPNHNRAEELISAPWSLNSIRSHGREMVIGYSGSGCRWQAGVTTTETHTYVIITAYDLVPRPTRAPQPCTANLTVEFGFVRLSKPLGGRTLYHAPQLPPGT